MASVTQKFVLVGPHAGKTLNVNGHEFVDGEYTFQGSAEQVGTLSRIFADYAALPEEQAELAQLKAEKTAQTQGQAPQAPQAPTEPAGKPTLGEAIGQLDPEDDKHWTSNNLPALDVLEAMTGKKVARSDVDAVAEGYTRAKARAAKQ